MENCMADLDNAVLMTESDCCAFVFVRGHDLGRSPPSTWEEFGHIVGRPELADLERGLPRAVQYFESWLREQGQVGHSRYIFRGNICIAA